ncbi:response regulator [Corallococcus exiguus]|uniref:Response regulator n=1 Tax=Corallococcus exiguus TaxID=83462 RepID=A0A7X4YFR9_9BACT|nr:MULTISPECIES: response regulator [Corallococcus]MBN8467982.1 response regulator [Corallococcus exiguus]NBC43612.1 response regulator [Corallococcus exiguus]NNC20410.1 response regulator [Corallococcus exiguus]NRD57882.1 response regulator [Corallococcus exiguus]NRD66011.1 response regulator [Corallococcus exiguus]
MGPVLIVDDEFGIVEAVRDLLSDEGYRTATALNGREALERMRQERPSMILLDYMMPVLNGPGVLESMQKDPALRDVPVVMMSASPPDFWQHLPCAGFLPKPFDIEQLLGMVRRMIGPPPVTH